MTIDTKKWKRRARLLALLNLVLILTAILVGIP